MAFLRRWRIEVGVKKSLYEPATWQFVKALLAAVIPTRRVKSISKLFCIEDLIRRGFI